MSGALGVVGDFYSMVFPLVFVWHLKLAFRKKLALYILFSLGSL